MNEVLIKANELVGVLQQKITYYGKLVRDTNVRAEKMDTRDNEFSVKLNDMAVREAKIKPGESVVALRELAIIEKKEADELLKSLHKEKDDFNKHTSIVREEIAKDRQQLKIDKDKGNKEMVMIQKEWDALKKEQETWKNKFFENLVTTSMQNRK